MKKTSKKDMKYVDDLSHCPECGMKWHYVVDGKQYSKIVGHEDPNIYDGVCEWSCPECEAVWDRFTNKLTRKGSKGGKATR
jgi:hypothetical protein